MAKCLTGKMQRLDAETETLIACQQPAGQQARGGFFDGTPVYGIDEECNGTVDVFGTLLKGGEGGTRQSVAYSVMTAQTGRNGSGISKEIAATLDRESPQAVAYPINSQIAMRHEALGEGTGMGIGGNGDPSFTLLKNHSHAVAFAQNQAGELRVSDIAGTINTNSNASGRATPMTQQGMTVRRLTPVECERLQGFPDNYTKISDKTADGPRYKAMGNSMAVPVMRWLGERIQMVEDIINAP